MSATTARKKSSVWRNPRARREAIAAYMFLSPYLLVTFVFTVGVFLFAIYVSFTEFNLYTTPEWVGLKHYKSVFSDGKFVRSLGHTTIKFTCELQRVRVKRLVSQIIILLM